MFFPKQLQAAQGGIPDMMRLPVDTGYGNPLAATSSRKKMKLTSDKLASPLCVCFGGCLSFETEADVCACVCVCEVRGTNG